jgi:hypothetical protein
VTKREIVSTWALCACATLFSLINVETLTTVIHENVEGK